MSQTTITEANWPETLLALLEHQHQIVGRLALLCDSQAALVAGAPEAGADGLLDLLANRQALIDEFTASQERLTSLTHNLDQRLSGIAAVQRTNITNLINKIGDMLAQVMRRDEQDQAVLRRARDQVKSELHAVGSGRAARSAYVGGTSIDANRFADRRG